MNDGELINTKCAAPESCNFWFCHHHGKCLHHEHVQRNVPLEQIKPKSIFFPPDKKTTNPGGKKGIKKVYFKDNGKYFTPDRVYGNDKFIFCHYCGSLIPIALITRDHKIPVAKGGTAERGNILPACITCNTEKGKMDYIDYLQYRYRSGRTMSQEATKNFETHLKV